MEIVSDIANGIVLEFLEKGWVLKWYSDIGSKLKGTAWADISFVNQDKLTHIAITLANDGTEFDINFYYNGILIQYGEDETHYWHYIDPKFNVEEIEKTILQGMQ